MIFENYVIPALAATGPGVSLKNMGAPMRGMGGAWMNDAICPAMSAAAYKAGLEGL